MKLLGTTFILCFLLASAALADATFTFVPVKTAQEIQSRELLEKGSYKEVLNTWDSSFSEKFRTSPTGHALYSYMLMKTGLQVVGLETLFTIKKPKEIDQLLREMIRDEVPATSPIWKQAQVAWNSQWLVVFPQAVENMVFAWNAGNLRSKDLGEIEKLTTRTQVHTNEWAWLQWQLALSNGLNNHTKVAATHLQNLLESTQTAVSRDQILMSSARLLYQDNHLEAALRYYDMISKNSDFWPEALEEKAWTYVRQENYEKGLAELHTLLSPVLAPQAGPEPYFLKGLAALKICDYKTIFDSLKSFKERYKPRLLDMQALAKAGQSPAATRAIAKMQTGLVAWHDFGRDVEKLPRLFNRDEILARRIVTQKATAQELTRVQLTATEAGKNLAKKRNEIALKLIQDRMKRLAKNEVSEISKILTKLQIVEAEAIQRMHLNPHLTTNKVKDKSNDADALIFPDKSEVWLDELDHYQVNAKGCPAKGAQTL